MEARRDQPSGHRRAAPLKILIHGLNFSPELTGIGKYTGEMAFWLASHGHDVRVITTPPYYPAWRIDPPFRNRRTTEHPLPNLTVHRCPFYVPARPSGLKRMLHLGSFALSSLVPSLREVIAQPDVMLTVEPTFFAAPVALLLARLAEAPAWLHVQDFEIDAAFDLGLLPSGGTFHALALALERRITCLFDRISSISPRMLDRALAKGVPAERLVLFPNWVDLTAVQPVPSSAPNGFRQQLNLQGKIVLLYSGNMGNKQGLEVLPALAEILAADDRVHLVFCGDGAFRPTLEALVDGVRNVTLLPLQPPERLNELLNLADIHLLPQKSDVADLVMPSKLTGMLASGRPVLAVAAAGTQVAQVVSGMQNNEPKHVPCGLVVDCADPQLLAGAARSMIENQALRDRLGAGARLYAEQHLGQNEVLGRFEKSLSQLAGQSRS